MIFLAETEVEQNSGLPQWSSSTCELMYSWGAYRNQFWQEIIFALFFKAPYDGDFFYLLLLKQNYESDNKFIYEIDILISQNAIFGPLDISDLKKFTMVFCYNTKLIQPTVNYCAAFFVSRKLPYNLC